MSLGTTSAEKLRTNLGFVLDLMTAVAIDDVLAATAPTLFTCGPQMPDQSALGPRDEVLLEAGR